MANINGTGLADTLRGTAVTDVIWARGGNDTIIGLAGADRLYGEAGNDTIYGGDGNDRMGGGFGDDRLFGDTGDDTIFADAGRDYLWGGAGNDDLAGGADRDVLRGNSGNDILRGDGGDDLLEGGAGNDLFYGGSGADVFDGGEGVDTVSYVNETQGVFVHLAARYAPGLWPDLEDHLIYESLAGIQRVLGSDHDDALFGVLVAAEEELYTPIALFGRGGNDSLRGGYAGDELEGNDGSDFIDGKIGNDRINGGTGDDELNGGFGAGDDRLIGGSGEDSFRYSTSRLIAGPDDDPLLIVDTTGADIITDFRSGDDMLVWDVRAIGYSNDGHPITNVSYRRGDLFDALDTNEDNKISGLDRYADSKVVEGVRSLVIDFSTLLNAKLEDGHDLEATWSGDRLTLLGLNSLGAQDVAAS